MSSYTYIDLLIEVLSDHEKNLDELVSRLEKITHREEQNSSEFYSPTLEEKAVKLQSIINNYEKILTKITNHCNIIDDQICKKIIKEINIEK